MTPRELDAFNAGISHAADVALTAAITIEIRDDADKIRQRAAVAALQGLAEGLKLATSKDRITGSLDEAHTDIMTSRAAAITQGFTGDTCDACGSSEMNRSGTCLTCQSCGSTTGCG